MRDAVRTDGLVHPRRRRLSPSSVPGDSTADLLSRRTIAAGDARYDGGVPPPLRGQARVGSDAPPVRLASRDSPKDRRHPRHRRTSGVGPNRTVTHRTSRRDADGFVGTDAAVRRHGESDRSHEPRYVERASPGLAPFALRRPERAGGTVRWRRPVNASSGIMSSNSHASTHKRHSPLAVAKTLAWARSRCSSRTVPETGRRTCRHTRSSILANLETRSRQRD